LKAKIALMATARIKSSHADTVIRFYKSPLFQKSVAYARLAYNRFYFYNAPGGLLMPDRIMEPDNLSIRALSPAERRIWAQRVIEALSRCERLNELSLFLHGGRVYRNYLEPELTKRGIAYTVPLAGLSIGKQLRWYTRQIAALGCETKPLTASNK
jgi:hypothetical protein